MKTDCKTDRKIKTDRDVMQLIAADAPLSLLQAAKIYGIDAKKLKHATESFRSSRGQIGLRCFTLPGSVKVRVRASAIKDWFAALEQEMI